jgi:FkbM family methyltransferase
VKVAQVCQHSFLDNRINRGSLVVDCGVNQGGFSRWISEKIGCQVHGFEPDPRLFSQLPALPKCTFHQVAISDNGGSMMLYLGDRLCSSLHYKEDDARHVLEVKTVTLPEFCRQHAIEKIDLLKLDIEGEELPVFASLDDSFLREKIAQVTVEFHDHLDKSVIPQIKDTIRRMRALGFYCQCFSLYTFGDVLLVNTRLVNLSMLDIVQLKLLKYQRGLFRMVRRMIS